MIEMYMKREASCIRVNSQSEFRRNLSVCCGSYIPEQTTSIISAKKNLNEKDVIYSPDLF